MQDTNLSGATVQDTVFTETFDVITAVAISPSGRYWAAASMRGELLVWREAGQTLHRFRQAHTDQIWTMAFGPDERSLVTGSFDGTLKLWDAGAGYPALDGLAHRHRQQNDLFPRWTHARQLREVMGLSASGMPSRERPCRRSPIPEVRR